MRRCDGRAAGLEILLGRSIPAKRAQQNVVRFVAALLQTLVA
jgi:hypothetical protein